MIFALVLSLFIITCRCQKCYWPDGSEARNYKICAEGRGQCCYNKDVNNRDLCYDNGFCFSSFYGEIYRGACTDKRWDPKVHCAPTCRDISLKASVRLTGCDDKGKFCCGGVEDSKDCCANDQEGFPWSNATLFNMPQVTTTITAVSAPVQTMGNEGDSPPVLRKPKVGFGAGIGVGVGASIALLGGVWLVWRALHRRRDSNSDSDDGTTPQGIENRPVDPTSQKVYPYIAAPLDAENSLSTAPLHQAVIPAEMDDGTQRHELPIR